MKHQTISFIKSGIRILGYFVLAIFHPIAGLVLVASELVGIVEEFGHE